MVFDNSCAAFYPVAIIYIENTADIAHLGVMDVATDDAIETPAAGFGGESSFEPIDRFDGSFHLVFQPCRERPIRVTKPAPQRIEPAIDNECCRVGPVTQKRQEFCIAHDAIERVTVDNQQVLALRGRVRGFGAKPDTPDFKAHRQPITKQLIMVTGNVSDLSAVSGMAQDKPQYLVVVIVPVPRFPQPPPVDDIPYQIQMLATDLTKKIREKVTAASTSAEVSI